MPPDLTARVRIEIESLHKFFVGWFSGALSEGRFEPDFFVRFAPDFLLIPPAGTLLTRVTRSLPAEPRANFSQG